jgi:hypothetical protein
VADCGACISTVGAALARDGITAYFLAGRSVCIASKLGSDWDSEQRRTDQAADHAHQHGQ